MSRRRYLSTDISLDKRVNRLAEEYGDFAALLYTWMIPHAADTARLSGDAEELLYTIVPGRRSKTVEDIEAALAGMVAVGLIEWVRGEYVAFPAEAFYRYQSYIREGNRRQSPHDAESDANQRESPQNRVSFSPSFSSSPSPSEETTSPLAAAPPSERPVRPAPKPKALRPEQQARFRRWYAGYPNKQHRPEAERAWAKLDPDDALTDALTADVEARQEGRKWAEGFIEHPATYLNNRVWEDDIEALRPIRAGPATNGTAATFDPARYRPLADRHRELAAKGDKR
jgi:hypothetical protein